MRVIERSGEVAGALPILKITFHLAIVVLPVGAIREDPGNVHNKNVQGCSYVTHSI